MAKSDSTRQLTVLTTRGVNAVKTFAAGKKCKVEVEGYGRAKRFTHRTIKVDDEGKWLKALASESQSFVVLGDVIDKSKTIIRRLSSARDGDDATIDDVPRSLMPIDVDRIGFEPMADVDDGETFAGEVLDWLGLKGTGCVWHLTNSHGFDGKYRIRLWVELEEPATAAQMKEFAAARWDALRVDGKRCVDTSVYQPQQPIYTGDPILKGVKDPVTRRTGHIDGQALKLEGVTPKRKTISGAPEDENVARLGDAGIYIERLRPGQHMIECPWEDEHTGPKRRDDTFYFEPHFNGHDIPAFKCHHDSCSKRKWDDVLEWMGEEAGRDDGESDPNWVYVHRRKGFWDARDGELIEREVYDSTHGGRNKRGTPTERFLAKKEAQKADESDFVPWLGRFFKRKGKRVLNEYVDARAEPVAGSARPYLDYLAALIPDASLRDWLLDWMAHLYQQVGRNLTQIPVLIGPSGNGKTKVFEVLCRCVGEEHCIQPTTEELAGQFNGWLHKKLFVFFEELYTHDRKATAQKLKPTANKRITIHKKYENPFSVTNVTNVAACSNEAAPIVIEADDRRFAIIQTATLDQDERERMTGDLEAWCDDDDGIGKVASFLNHRDISAFRPFAPAPMTEAKRMAVQLTRLDRDELADLAREVAQHLPVVTTDILTKLRDSHGLKVPSRHFGWIASRNKWSVIGRIRHAQTGVRSTAWSARGQSHATKLANDLGRRVGQRQSDMLNDFNRAFEELPDFAPVPAEAGES